jgi:hypothetical protein
MRLALVVVAGCAPTVVTPTAAPPPPAPAGIDLEAECAKHLVEWPRPQASGSCEGPGGTRDPACGPESSSSDGSAGPPVCDVDGGIALDAWTVAVYTAGPDSNHSPVPCRIAMTRGRGWWLVGPTYDCSLNNDRLEVRAVEHADDGNVRIMYTLTAAANLDGSMVDPHALRCRLGPPPACERP